MSTRTSQPTRAERAANAIKERAEKSTQVYAGEPRFTAEVALKDYAPEYFDGDQLLLPGSRFASVTVRDRLTGGSLYACWRTVTEGGTGTTRFFGGDYRWTASERCRQIKSLRDLANKLHVFLELGS